ncbi:MAG: NifU family protein [Gemmatimonadales bacterium]
MDQLTISFRPDSPAKCTVEVNREFAPSDRVFTRDDDCSDSPLAAAILALPAVVVVRFQGNAIAIEKTDDKPWSALEERIAYAVQVNLDAAVAPSVSGSATVDEDQMFDEIEEFLERQINPSIAQHNGRVDLVDIQDSKLVVRMMGGCQGCGMANVTLKQGIETSIRKIWPSIVGIVDVTDHASGTNPYFTAEKK